MNNQEFVALVEDAINKFEKQNAFSKDNGSACFYLNPEGNCCIVGHMMPNDEVRLAADEADESSIVSLYDREFEWATQFNKVQLKLLHNLQSEHDIPEQDFNTAVNCMRGHLDFYKDTNNV